MRAAILLSLPTLRPAWDERPQARFRPLLGLVSTTDEAPSKCTRGVWMALVPWCYMTGRSIVFLRVQISHRGHSLNECKS